MSFFLPDRFFSRVTAIDIQKDILDKGYSHIIFDLDNTLLTRDTHEIPEDVQAWLVELKKTNLTLAILSNNFHEGAHIWARRLEMPVVSHAFKPLPFAYGSIMRTMKATRHTTLCIGDQLITDVWGAHGRRMSVYLVQPLVEKDLKHTLLFRNIERLFMKDIKPER